MSLYGPGTREIYARIGRPDMHNYLLCAWSRQNPVSGSQSKSLDIELHHPCACCNRGAA